MKLVADTNIFLAVVLNESQKSWILEVTRDAELVAPAVLPYECGNALSAIVKRRGLTTSQALAAHRLLDRIPVALAMTDVHGALKLALEHGIYAYDAYFLRCAQVLHCPLLTLDRNMRNTARALGIRCLEA